MPAQRDHFRDQRHQGEYTGALGCHADAGEAWLARGSPITQADVQAEHQQCEHAKQQQFGADIAQP